jgi:hypothetical protein
MMKYNNSWDKQNDQIKSITRTVQLIKMRGKTTREMIIETNRDVKWMCETLKRIDKCNEDLEGRIRTLEGWKSEAVGNEKKGQQLSAGIGAGAGGVVAILMKVLGGG